MKHMLHNKLIDRDGRSIEALMENIYIVNSEQPQNIESLSASFANQAKE